MNEYIIAIYFENLTDDEFNSIHSTLISELKLQPKQYNNNIHFGVKIVGGEYYWSDSVSNYSYSIKHYSRKENSSINLTVTNDVFLILFVRSLFLTMVLK